jgi:hypothetical protein
MKPLQTLAKTHLHSQCQPRREVVELRNLVVRLRILVRQTHVKIESLQAIMLGVAQARSVDAGLRQIVEGVADCSNVALVRIWLVAPGDICGSAAFAMNAKPGDACTSSPAPENRSEAATITRD